MTAGTGFPIPSISINLVGTFDPAGPLGAFLAAAEPRYALTIRSEVPIPLRTGKRHPGEGRAAHARRVRLARVRRRHARRRGVPVATMRRQDYWPSVSIADRFRAHEQGLVDRVQRRRAIFGQAWSEAIGFVVNPDGDWAELEWSRPDAAGGDRRARTQAT